MTKDFVISILFFLEISYPAAVLARQSATNEAAPTNSLIFGATFDITSFLPDGSKGTEEGD